ncbi:MAG: ISAs1 family transposase [Dethiosulfovibrio peptidovorans]|nr:MAG: ISAs1 family transposase [Dethiosulfovibrio peptidovorans]
MPNKTRRDKYAAGFPDGFEEFEILEDPRSGKYPRHYFGEIIFIALAAMICGSEGFDDFERFAKTREKWLRKHLRLPGGVPSNDTFRRIFTRIDPDRFCECFAAFVLGISGRLKEQLIAIDGKTLRHSFENADPTTSLHLISAWACENQLTLGQLAVDGKSNEITAVPELIRQLDLEGHTVSLDAMGCQKAIARSLYLERADYILALKANHPNFHQRLEAFFNSPAHIRQTQSLGKTLTAADVKGKAHGRRERRVVLATDHLDWIDKNERESWLGLKSVVCVEAHRKNLSTDKKSVQKRYYLTSLEPDAARLQELIRQHWSIENQCHWILDVTFDGDQSRARKGYAAANLAMLRKVVLSLLKNDTIIKDTIRGKRYRAALDESILENIIFPKSSR